MTRRVAPQLPPRLKRDEELDAISSVLRFEKNWLLGTDKGEWGGGLWLTNEDGSKTKRILADNVQAMLRFDGGVLVLSGLAHLERSFGNAFIFSVPEGMNIALQRAVHLDGAPSAFAREPDGSVLFVTTSTVQRIKESGELRWLFTAPGWMQFQYPNSMAVTPDGDIYVGMRMFVLKLHPSSGRYTAEWLLPNDCRKFELRESDCVCKP